MTKPKTGSQRVADSEARKRERGLTKTWFWVYPEDKETLRKYAAKLRKKREE